MIELGKRIAFHRRRLNLTQTELGEMLNVTAQAVSKWENGISDPDLGTLQRISKIFGVSTDELIAEESEEAPEVAAADAATEPSAEATDIAEPSPTPIVQEPAPAPQQPKIIIGYCHNCKRPIEQREKYFLKSGGRGRSDYILCKKCEREREISEKRSTMMEEERSFRRSMIWGSVAAGVSALLFLIVALSTQKYAVLAGLVLSLGLFTMVSQCFWGDWLVEFMAFFFRSFRMPGVIFTLDIDGIVWAILVKIFLGFFSALLSGICALIGILLSLLVSIFSFPFAILHKRHRIGKARAEYEMITKKEVTA